MGKKAIYIGLFLTPGSKQGLRIWSERQFGALLEKEFMHHTTLKFKPSIEEMETFKPYMGHSVVLNISRAAQDEKCQAIVVSPANEYAEEVLGLGSNEHAHITVSTDGTSPVYSNNLLTTVEGDDVRTALQLIATVGIFTGKEVVYSLEGSIYE